MMHEVEAVIDTSFTEYLALTDDLIRLLQLPLAREEIVIQSNGEKVMIPVYSGDIKWNGERVTTEVQGGGVEPLVGMVIIWGYTLTVRGETDGLFSLKAFDEDINP